MNSKTESDYSHSEQVEEPVTLFDKVPFSSLSLKYELSTEFKSNLLCCIRIHDGEDYVVVSDANKTVFVFVFKNNHFEFLFSKQFQSPCLCLLHNNDKHVLICGFMDGTLKTFSLQQPMNSFFSVLSFLGSSFIPQLIHFCASSSLSKLQRLHFILIHNSIIYV